MDLLILLGWSLVLSLAAGVVLCWLNARGPPFERLTGRLA